jgi:acetate kinase
MRPKSWMAWSVPEELARREDRLAKLAEARAKIEARAKERFEQEMAELPYELFTWIWQHQRQQTIKAIGHRVVPDGNNFIALMRIDDQVMEKLVRQRAASTSMSFRQTRKR